MIDELFSGVFRLEIPLPHSPLKMLNAYLIRGQERHLLIDTGFNRSECHAVLSDALNSIGVNNCELDFFLTHRHADHCGLASSICGPGAIFYASAKDSTAINNTTHWPEYWTDFLRRMIPHGMNEEQITQISEIHPAILYCPSHELDFSIVGTGDILQYGGYTLTVIEVPGHTPVIW